MGIFDGINNAVAQSRATSQQAAQSQATSALSANYSNYAPEFTNYNSQAGASIASAAAQNAGYAARGSALFDDAATKKGQINLDNAGIGISRDANARQLSLLQQLQGFSGQRYNGNVGYFNQQLGLADWARRIDDLSVGTRANTDRRNSVSDAVGRGAIISGGHKADMRDIGVNENLSRQTNANQYEGKTAGLNNQLANAGLDYNADKLTRYADMGGIGDSSKRLDLDVVNNALQMQATDRNAGTQKKILDSQIAANNAQAQAALSSIEAQRNALFRQMFGQP